MNFNAEQPEYRRLRTRIGERVKDVVFWVGAGISAPAGLPTWRTLREYLCDQADEMIATLDAKEREKQGEVADSARISNDLWMAFERLRGVLGPASFTAAIREILGNVDEKTPPHLYRDIWNIPSVTAVITLNIDNFVATSHRIVRTEERNVVQFMD